MPGSRTSASAFRESGDFTGRRLARSRVFSIRLIPDWKVRAVLGSFLFFRLVPKTESRDASEADKARKVEDGSPASAIFSEEKHHVETNKHAPGASSRSERDRARTHARVSRCRSSTRSWPAGPPCWRSTPATAGTSPRSPRRCVPCHLSDSLEKDSARRVARRLASRRSPRARRAPTGARARKTPRASRAWTRAFRGRPPLSRKVPRRPPAEDGGGAKRPFASVFFATDSDQISSLSASPAPYPRAPVAADPAQDDRAAPGAEKVHARGGWPHVQLPGERRFRVPGGRG